MVDGEMFPLVLACIPGKSEDIYARFFNLLKTACTRQIHLNPTTFFIDYGVSVQNAAINSFPDITIKGRFFHYIVYLAESTGYSRSIHSYICRAAVLPLINWVRFSVKTKFNIGVNVFNFNKNLPNLCCTFSRHWIFLFRHSFERGPSKDHHSQFCLIWFNGFRGEIFKC